MPIQTVSDTSPLQYLHQLGHLTLLEKLYGQVLIPLGVAEELKQGLALGFDLPDLSDLPWIEVHSITVPDDLEQLELGKGEKQAIALARATAARLLLDDLEARQQALSRGLEVTGTLGILLLARGRGWVPALAPLLSQLCDLGFYLGDQLRGSLLRRAGEL